LCRGLLSGRIMRDTRFTGDDIRHEDPKFQAPRLNQYIAAVQQLDHFAQENYGKRVIHLAVRWVLDREGITFALWGARRPEQLGAVAEIAGWKIDASAMREIDRIVASCVKQPVGPEFMAPPDRLAA
jgi:aryl-alcohol dehydrogenase-like predicted oxidoreductase